MMSQTENIGDVTIQYYDVPNGDDYLEITYTLTNLTWALNETHVDVQLNPDDFPLAKGNPKIGHFDYSNDTHLPGETTYTYTIYGEWDNVTLYIAAHAEVSILVTEEIIDENGNIATTTYYVYETAWGNGTDFPRKNWAMYSTIQIPDE